MRKVAAINKSAKYHYHIEEKYESGIILEGAEVKSIRSGKVNIEKSYVFFNKGEPCLTGAYIGSYSHSSAFAPDPYRVRKLLLNKREIRKLFGKVKTKGYSVIPCVIYFNDRNKVKVEIALVRGKKSHDKREAIKQREWSRDKARILKCN
ncbi:SsrA-binding protein SmpB [Candidatus Sneabacter namystus]|uniref:SsrA-binding protein n=1 Tax=Candidatus Sneabacter namystus TaxID=2601646 RepID=A0A5C0UL44_9RICK|nr:SsrA-binding protein SmpB [Candidatus Sneabacter namystus]QEK39574.1 SsrA-binding protein SmpB [Candidatus Sneabacter namystus]